MLLRQCYSGGVRLTGVTDAVTEWQCVLAVSSSWALFFPCEAFGCYPCSVKSSGAILAVSSSRVLLLQCQILGCYSCSVKSLGVLLAVSSSRVLCLQSQVLVCSVLLQCQVCGIFFFEVSSSPIFITLVQCPNVQILGCF